MILKKRILLVFLVAGILPLLLFLILSIDTPATSVYGQMKRDIQITNPISGASIPHGLLTIHGVSKDDASKNCTVYGYYNNLKKIATPNRIGMNDYSKWTLTYVLYRPGYNTIKVELSCPGLSSSYDSINVYVRLPL